MNLKQMKLAALGAIAVAAFAQASTHAALAQETLVINSFGGAYEKIHRDLVITPFEEKYNVKVEVITAYSADTLAQLKAQKDNPKFDVVHFSGGLEHAAAAEGLLAPIKPEELSHYSEMYPFAVAELEKGVGPTYSTAVIGLLYNTEKVTTAPTSWKDLAKPEFAGHVLLTDAASNTYGMLGMLMINQVSGGTLDDIQPGLDFVKGILPDSTVVAKSPEIQQNFAQGNAWIAPYAQDYAYTLTKAGLPIKFVQPEEGGVLAPITVNLVAGAKHRDLALKFIDFSIRAEASKGWAEALRYSPTNKTAEISPEAASEVVYGEAAAAKLVSFDANVVAEKRPSWNEAWSRTIAK